MPHAIINYDNERVTIVSKHDEEAVAEARLEALEDKHPNGAFDLVPSNVASHLLHSESEW